MKEWIAVSGSSYLIQEELPQDIQAVGNKDLSDYRSEEKHSTHYWLELLGRGSMQAVGLQTEANTAHEKEAGRSTLIAYNLVWMGLFSHVSSRIPWGHVS